MKKLSESIQSVISSRAGRAVAFAVCAALAAAVLLAPLYVSKYLLRILIMLLVYAVLAISLNMITGYLGEISLGHIIFFAIGAYASSLLVLRLGMNCWLAAFLGSCIAGAFGALLGLQTLRISGTYLAIVSLGYYYVIRMVIINWMSLTNGANGLFNIPAPSVFGVDLVIRNGGAYYHILAFLLLTMLVNHLVVNSKIGRAIKAVREDRLAADLVGIFTDRYRVFAFAFGGFFAGLAGSFYAQLITYINPSNFTYDMSIMVLCMVILGGRGSVKGMLLGAAVISPLGEVLRQLTMHMPAWLKIENPDQWRFVIFGLILVLMMQFRPLGVFGGLDKKPYRLPKGVTIEEGGARNGLS